MKNSKVLKEWLEEKWARVYPEFGMNRVKSALKEAINDG